MMADRELVWELLTVGLPSAPVFREEILSRQDTHTLVVWKVAAVTFIEEISDVLEARTGGENYPTEGMSE